MLSNVRCSLRWPIGFVALLATFHCCLLNAAEDQVGYSRQIRPLLSDRCFQCHGPDENHRGGGLRLDLHESATSETDSGYVAIVPGDVSESELMARILSDDPDLVMPPPESGKKLSDDERALFKQWIEEGAEYESHWAFNPPTRSTPPEVKKTGWSSGAIDRFILADLESHGLSPSVAADRVTLLRRVTLDLTGLPPTREETAEFLADRSPDAYERVVDRLLASPRYGEHVARYWLDAVRYGDTHGLHLDNYREMWPYRDWVVRAMNDNMPWDQFTVMQVAGDLLPNATLDDKIASGFNRCHVSTNEGGSIAEEIHARNVVDRVSTTGTVFLGLTMGCAVCHDHKFDPITMQDFYSTYAFFNNMDGKAMDDNRADPAPTIDAPSLEQQAKLAQLEESLQGLEAKLAAPRPTWDESQAAWEEATAPRCRQQAGNQLTMGTWHSVGPFRSDKRYLLSRNQGPENLPIDLNQIFTLSNGKEIKWEVQPSWKDGEIHYDLSQKISATFLYRTIESPVAQNITMKLGTDDGVKVYLNGNQIHRNRATRSVKPGADKIKLSLTKGVNDLLIKVANYGGKAGFCFSLAKENTGLPAEIIAALQIPSTEQNDAQKLALQQHFRQRVCDDESLKNLLEQIAEVRTEISLVKSNIPSTLIMKERTEPRPAFVLLRGAYDSPDKDLGPLARAVPKFLPPMPADAPKNRLGYAQWLIAADNPLMARVTVNRFWQQFFGTGIVETAGDFGSQGSWPSHPELLDWLAVDFRESGWDVKRFAKQIVMSRTYRQSSKTTPDIQAVDPQNRLLAHGPRFRLDAEVIRDQALSVSGLLVNKLGGPGVRPPQPSGLWKAVAYSTSNTNQFKADTGSEKVHRRSLYTFWKRTSPPPQLTTLDAPSRESCIVRRERTNTPLAALLLLNDPQYVEAARKLAERSMLDGSGKESGIARSMLQFATLREPSDDDVMRLNNLYESSLSRYEKDSQAVDKLLNVGEASIDTELARAELAAWTLAANAVLNLDEVLNKE